MKYILRNRVTSLIFIVILSIFVLTSCDIFSDSVSPTEPERGKIIETELTASLPSGFIDTLFTFAGELPDFLPRYDVTVYKLVYNTLDPQGNVVQASGAIFVPSLNGSLPMASIQHGTESMRSNVASVDPFHGYEGIIAASLGYYAVMPDYLGMGVSQIMHPYHLEKPSADCVIDIIRAGKTFAQDKGINLSGKIFLAGYSEGGYVTLAAQKEIDVNYHDEIHLTAVSAMAGAYDLLNSSTDVISKDEYNMPGYIAFLVTAYNEVYNWNRLGDFYNEPYASKMPGLFDGSKTISEINLELTNNISELFKSDFINRVSQGTETELINALTENSLLDWTPVTPLLLVHGNADEYVPYQNSVSALEAFTNRGAENVHLITIEGGTHLTSVLPAIVATLNWFEQF
jgi:pimeloyl-ACP methyl ester carboxylesterase